MSRRVRKMGQVRVFGLKSVKSSADSVNLRSVSFNCSGLVQEEREFRFRTGAVGTAQGEQTELIGAVYSWEHTFPVLEIVEADECTFFYKVSEKVLIERICSDSCRQHKTCFFPLGIGVEVSVLQREGHC